MWYELMNIMHIAGISMMIGWVVGVFMLPIVASNTNGALPPGLLVAEPEPIPNLRDQDRLILQAEMMRQSICAPVFRYS